MPTRRKIETAEEIWEAALAETPVEQVPDGQPIGDTTIFFVGLVVGMLYNFILQGFLWVIGAS